MNMSKPTKPWMKILLPLAVLSASLALLIILVGLRPEPERQAPVPNYPAVEIHTVLSEPVRVNIDAQGTIQPRQRTRLTARVSGHIEWVSQNFYEGGSFKAGDVLLRLDPLPYESALAEAKSRLALAESALFQEQEAAEQARLDWAAVGSGEPTPLVLREPQLAKAKADREAAEVSVTMARENLSYTEIRAPYAGRVQAKHVDVGQAITAQATILGEIFSTDAMEIPLAISLDDLAFIGPLEEQPKVFLYREIAGVDNTWEAYLDRTAASIDERSRMITAYARMNPPFISNRGTALTPGMFVTARIEGRRIPEAKRIPRAALQPGNIVYRLSADNRLESVQLDILRTAANWALATDGLKAGDRICLTPLLFFVEGMKVEPVDNTDQPTEPDP
jgi:RND family efflux transporter MFP subunit